MDLVSTHAVCFDSQLCHLSRSGESRGEQMRGDQKGLSKHPSEHLKEAVTARRKGRSDSTEYQTLEWVLEVAASGWISRYLDLFICAHLNEAWMA